MKISFTAIGSLLLAFVSATANASPFEIESRRSELIPNRISISWPYDENSIYKLLYAPIPYTGPKSVQEVTGLVNGHIFADLPPGSKFFVAMAYSTNSGKSWSDISNIVTIDVPSVIELGRKYHYQESSWNTSDFEFLSSGEFFSGIGVDAHNAPQLEILDINFDGCDEFITDSGDLRYPGPRDANGNRTDENSAEWIRENVGYPIRIFLNDCIGGLQDISESIFTESRPLQNVIFTPTVIDLNDDGWGEIFISDSGFETKNVVSSESESDRGFSMWPGGKTVLMSKPNGEYFEDRTLLANYQYPVFGHGLGSGDINGDGNIDIALWNQGIRRNDGLAMKAEIYLGTDNGKFLLQKNLGDDLVYEKPNSKSLWSGTVEFIDLDQDSREEFASTGEKEILRSDGSWETLNATNFYRWEEGYGLRKFAEISDSKEFMNSLGICFLGSPASTLRPLHLNEDGILDLAIRYEVQVCTGEKELDVVYRFLIHDGNYGFEDAPTTLTPTPGAFFPRIGHLDFLAKDDDSDGISELYANDQDSHIYSKKFYKWSMMDDKNYYPDIILLDGKPIYEALPEYTGLDEQCCFMTRWFNADGDDDLDLLVYKIRSLPEKDEENYVIPYWIFTPKKN